MSLQFDLFTDRVPVSPPGMVHARSGRGDDVTVNEPPSRPAYLNPICHKCGGAKAHYPNANDKRFQFRCRPCDTSARRKWRKNKGKDRDRDARDTPEKYRARVAVREAVRRGELIRQPCELCATTERVQAHHEDYAKPLDVMWLCPPHHRERHRFLDLRSKEQSRAAAAPAVNMVCSGI